MAKILVADDNSNIQKMVVLALKDQGIDVVAVGNGEAAVRKIADLRPDLVLADVFMPVRNGYEVCQYVKGDTALAHIPVILLVGAFDPLDEQEAQRVGADGVLKKPFVPADPLISMVKSALQRAGVAHGTASAEKTPELAPLKGTDLLEPSRAAMPILGTIPMQTVPPDEPIAAMSNESFVDEVPVRPEPLRIDSDSQPVAFGSLLETPTEEKEDPGYLGPPHPELAADRDWRDPDMVDIEEEEQEEKPAAWRHEEAESYAGGKLGGGAKDWRSGSFEQIQARKAHGESWEPVEEKPEAVETAPAASTNVKAAPAAPTVIPEPTTAIPASPFAKDAWAPAESQAKISTETATAVEEAAHRADRGKKASEVAVTNEPQTEQVQPETKTSKDSWFSVPSNPWDAEIEKANQLASGWDAPMPLTAPLGAKSGTETPVEAASKMSKAVIEEATLPPAAVKAIREEAAQVAEDAAQVAQQGSGETAFYTREEAAEAPAPTPSMDDLVAKVLAKMSPDVLQAVTREILKPVVEAMVKEELKSKKS